MRNWLFFLIFLVCLPLMTGCWDKQELTDLAIVNAVGIDKTDDGKYLATFQVINPGNVAGQSLGGGGSGIPVTVYSSTGENLVDAARKGSKKISRNMYYAHTNLVVLGEEVAREGVYKIFDALERDPQFRTTASIVVAENERAEDMLKVLTPIDKIPANKITKTLAFTEKGLGENIDMSVDGVIKILVNPGKQPVISGFHMTGDIEKGKGQENLSTTEAATRLEAGGIALFKNDKLVGWVYDQDARGVVWVQNKIKQTDIYINWKGKKKAIAYKVVRGKTSIHSQVKNGKPVIDIHIKTEGDIKESSVAIDLTNPKVIHQLERSSEKAIKEEVVHSINRVKEEKTDVFGFGNIIHREMPKLWNRELVHNWNEVGFPELEVRVDTEVYIRRSGLRNKPFLSEVQNE